MLSVCSNQASYMGTDTYHILALLGANCKCIDVDSLQVVLHRCVLSAECCFVLLYAVLVKRTVIEICQSLNMTLIFCIIFTVHSVLYTSFYFNQHMHYKYVVIYTPTYVSTTY
jgi:hypothetical protein